MFMFLFKMPVALTIAKVKEIFESDKCTLISEEYKNAKGLLEYKCNCGSDNIHKVSLENFKSGIRCPDCRQQRKNKTIISNTGYEHPSKNPELKDKVLIGLIEHNKKKTFTFDEVKKYYEDHDCIMMNTTEYKNNTQKIEFKCNICSKIYMNSFADFKHGDRCANRSCTHFAKRSRVKKN